MARKKDILTLSVPQGTKERLEAIAQEFQILWGDKPSPSGLVSAIAENRVTVGPVFRLSVDQAQALAQAVRTLLEAGQFDQAKSLMALLLNHGHVEEPVRQALLARLGQALEPWRLVVDQQIANRQPFLMHYQSASGRTHQFTVRHAQVAFREGRSYLEIWADETANNQDIPALRHNYVLRLDRVKNLVVLPSTGAWRDALDHVEARLRLTGRLATDYEPRPADVDTALSADGQERWVKRRVSSSFWFTREVMAYGPDCQVTDPPELRDRVMERLETIRAQYGGHE